MERPKRPYSLHARPTTSNRNRPMYYVVFRDETGAYGSAISTGCTRKDDAVRWSESELWRRKEQRESITFAQQACGNALILDEAQSIKNPATQSFDAGQQLKSRQRLRRMVQAFIPGRTKDVVERASLHRKRRACTRRWAADRNPPKKRGRSHTLDP